jgi:hypothetical protein
LSLFLPSKRRNTADHGLSAVLEKLFERADDWRGPALSKNQETLQGSGVFTADASR